MELQVGVKVLLQNKQGKYLMLRRSSKKYPEAAGRWTIVGGRINPGTSLKDNLQREVNEETGLSLVGKLQLIGAQDILKVPGFPGRHIVRLTYIAKAKGKVRLDEEESDDYGWFTLDSIKKMADVDIYLTQLLTDIEL